jgi:hypothetical protein
VSRGVAEPTGWDATAGATDWCARIAADMDAIVVLQARGRAPTLASSPPPRNPAAPEGLLLRTVVFRFVAVYFVLYNLPWPLGWIPRTEPVAQRYAEAMDWLLLQAGQRLLPDTEVLAPFVTGSGDTTRAWLSMVLQVAAAFVVCVLWSVFDRRSAHPRLAALLRTYLRYVLAVAMLGYGAAKFFGGQFPAIHDAMLATRWGDCSPMGVLWRFMGASPAYTVAAGIAECLGGLLLLGRRTATIGALVSAGVLVNVVLLNFCYDVPVKLYSLHLLVMAIAVGWRDVGRLLDVLWHHRAVAASPVRMQAPWWWYWPTRLAKVALVAWLVYTEGTAMVLRWRDLQRPPGPLHGVYEVVEFARDGKAQPPLLTDAARWHLVVIEDRQGKSRDTSLGVLDGRWQYLDYLPVRLEADDRSMWMDQALPTGLSGPPCPVSWSIAPLPAEQALAGVRQWRLAGPIDGAQLQVTLREVRRSDWPLLSRGFHWVQEYPHNR